MGIYHIDKTNIGNTTRTKIDEIRQRIAKRAEEIAEIIKACKIYSIFNFSKTNEDALVDIDENLNELNVKKVETGNKVTTSSYGMDEEKGNKLAKCALDKYRYAKAQYKCAAGVSYSIEEAFGYFPGKNGNTYAGYLAERSDWKEITSEIRSLDDLSNLPAGAVVSWSGYAGNQWSQKYGHVYISDGKGGEVSDHYFDSATCRSENQRRINGGGTYRVFVPV